MNENDKYTDGTEQCGTCEVEQFGSDGSLIPVWEDPADYQRGKSPDYLGCTECHTMRPVEADTE